VDNLPSMVKRVSAKRPSVRRPAAKISRKTGGIRLEPAKRAAASPAFSICQRVPVRGEVFSFDYPMINRHGVRLQIERRTVTVLELEDASKAPISLAEFQRRPNVRRGRWRLWGYDHQRYGKAAFYLDWFNPPGLQLVSYDVLTGMAADRFGDPFPQTEGGIAQLVALTHQARRQPLPEGAAQTLGICAVESTAWSLFGPCPANGGTIDVRT
jgi:hypothetical protein